MSCLRSLYSYGILPIVILSPDIFAGFICRLLECASFCETLAACTA